MKRQIKKEVEALVQNAKVAYVSSVDAEGCPNTKGMLALQHDGLFTHYFSTNYSTRRTRQFLQNPKACVYFCDEGRLAGLMLTGEMEVLTDHDSKAMLWREGFEMYYPDGMDTEDYCVYRFTARRANYYHGLSNCDFTLAEYENPEE